ncbi:LPXTG cell wall anchor domain-containing protein [Dactylosporangium sp. McL0621]|uniref:LPXTG cell wall anchor domain-containing protein n=1 Tax=Dactylosporangium sp. McL0621 TaxID=3415678 RepID=UPI003CE88230
MKKTLFRRAAVGVFAAAATVGLSTLFASPASAHDAGPFGKSDCGDNGTYTVTWTVQNDYPKSVDIKNISIFPTNETHAAIHLAAQGQPGDKASFTTTYSGDTKNDLVLHVTGLWADNYQHSFDSPKVTLSGNCKPTEHTPSPSKSPSKPATPEASRPATHAPSVSPSPSLPVTGSSSTLPMVGTGAALVAGGAALVFAIRRRRNITFTAE